MAEGADGHPWAGTQIGLNRIGRAGQRIIRRYFNDPENPASLVHDYVFSVYRDRQDVIWVATIEGGLNRYNAATDNFSRFDLAVATDVGVCCCKAVDFVLVLATPEPAGRAVERYAYPQNRCARET